MGLSNLKPETIMTFVAIGFAGWMLSKMFDKLSNAAAPVGNAIGDVLAPLLIGPAVSVKAAALLPSGARIAFDDIVKEGGTLKHSGGDTYTFTYRGVRYNVTGRIDDNTYRAVFA